MRNIAREFRLLQNRTLNLAGFALQDIYFSSHYISPVSQKLLVRGMSTTASEALCIEALKRSMPQKQGNSSGKNGPFRESRGPR